MRKYDKQVVRVDRPGNRGYGLGIFCHNSVILTCAHLMMGLKEPMLESEALFNIYSPHFESPLFISKASSADYCLDFMALCDMNFTGTGSAIEWWDENPHYVDLSDETPIPHQIVFEKTHRELPFTVIDGYFYDNDGLTPIDCEINISRIGFMLRINKHANEGSSGSPIFTIDHKLIGIITNIDIGIRIDLAMPKIVSNRISKDLPKIVIKDMGKEQARTDQLKKEGWN
jgi:hypothetical protein